MERIIRKVLNQIEKNGFEAYIIGGYVRDFLLGLSSWDIDICTNALPKELIRFFPNANVGTYGTVSFKVGKYSFEITTYRKEYLYNNRHPSQVEYINNLLEDIKRRDFTINTICMNQKGNIIDPLNARDDLFQHQIKMVGDVKTKIIEDPLRMLRAVRLATSLNFKLDKKLSSEIKLNSILVKDLSDYRIIDEITKIMINNNYQYGLQLLENLDVLKQLNISYSKIVKTSDVNGMWAQLNFKNNLAFTKETIHNISTIRKICQKKEIDKRELFDYGPYLCIIAGEIIGVDKKIILSKYKKMPIKSIKDIAITTDNIISFLKIKPGAKIGIILADLKNQILDGKLRNSSKEIYKYLNRIYRGDDYERL